MTVVDSRWLLVYTIGYFRLVLSANPVSIPKPQKHGNIVIAAVVSTSLLPDDDSMNECDAEGFDLNPAGPLVPCNFLDERLFPIF